jgi:hypothetical protein
MEDDYYIDLSRITLQDYEKQLATAELLPSRRILQEELHPRFDCLRAQGFQVLSQLLAALKTPPKIKALAQKSGLPEEYLVILKREINSSLPKPVDLADFPGLDPETVSKLALLGIANTRQLFARVKNAADRRALGEETGIPAQEILELTRLTDVCRIKWVGANFARLLVDSDWDTVEKVAQASYPQLHEQLVRINAAKQYFKGMFGLNDTKLCVLAARDVPQAIQY